MKKLGLALVGILLTIVLAAAWAGRDRSANEASMPADVTPAGPSAGTTPTAPEASLPSLPTTPMAPSGLPVTADPDQYAKAIAAAVWQPGAWDEVLTSGQAEPGWVVRNVLGQQTVHFLDSGVQRTTSRERTLTIGMRCPATGAAVERCWLTLVGVGVVS